MDNFSTIIYSIFVSVLAFPLFLFGKISAPKFCKTSCSYYPLFIYVILSLLYYYFGTINLIYHDEYMMLPPDGTFLYSILLTYIGIYSVIIGYKIVIKRNLTYAFVPSQRGVSALVILYLAGWLLRFKLMQLGLYQKYGYLENYQNIQVGEIVNAFLQMQTVMSVIPIAIALLTNKPIGKFLISVEIINSFVIGAKSAILLLLLFYIVVISLKDLKIFFYGKVFNFKTLLAVLVFTPVIYISSFISPYSYERGLVNSDDYLYSFVSNIGDFLSFVAEGGGELADAKYKSVRYAPVDAISGVVQRSISHGITPTYGEYVLSALEMMVPRSIYSNKPEHFGEDIEEQGALRHYSLPDGDICGTVTFSGYASFGLLGVILFNLFLGAFYASLWNISMRMSRNSNSLIRYIVAIFVPFYFINFLKVEQTFVTAVVLNARNFLVFVILATIAWSIAGFSKLCHSK